MHTTHPPSCCSYKVWDQQKKALLIKEEKSCGHAKCTRCSDINAGLEKYKGRADANGQEMYEKYRAEKICHDREHLGERDCECPP